MAEHPGAVFDEVAEQYEQVRPGYPPALVDTAVALGSLGDGSRVVEVGCGPGKLTVALASRGLSVDAVDPGPRLVEIARHKVAGLDVRFHVSRFEDAELPERSFDALFSATAFHWIDPAVGWAKVARLLRPAGMLALLTHVDTSGSGVHDEIVAAWREARPEQPHWTAHDPATLVRDAEARSGNVSELWSWLTRHDLARAEAAELFEDVRLATVAEELDETAAELIALIRTTSTYLALDQARRDRLESRITSAIDDAGGTLRTTIHAVLATARVAA
jgi:SAM-dependent methyltransferase